jgi:MATE family multidrug resistance protein
MRLMGLSIIPMLLFMTLKQFADGLEHTRTAMIFSLAGMPAQHPAQLAAHLRQLGLPPAGTGRRRLGDPHHPDLHVPCIGLMWCSAIKPLPEIHCSWTSKPVETSKPKPGANCCISAYPAAMQIGMEAGAFAVSGIIIGTLGAVAQAAHQIALSSASLTFMVSMGLAQAGSIRVSNALGRGDWTKIFVIGKSTLLTALIYGTICALAFAVFRYQLPKAFNDNAEVLALAALLLLFAAVFQISDSTQAIGAGLLRGIKDVKTPTILIGIAYWVIGIPFGYVLAFPFGMGASGMWLGLILGLTMASIFLMTRFFKMARRKPDIMKNLHLF